MSLKALSRRKFTSRTVVALMLLAFVGLVVLSTFEPLMFLNLPGLLTIILGTFCVAILSYSLDECIAAFKQLGKANKTDHSHIANEANIVLHFAQLWFRKQFIQIDKDLSKLDKPFLKKGLQMIRDRQSDDDILSLLNWQISQVNLREGRHIAVFRKMASVAPALGILGTVIALGNVVYMIEQGSAISAAASLLGFALVSTFYGLIIANFVFKPMAARLETRRIKEVQHITLLAEGIVQINERRTPAVIRDTMMTYIESMESLDARVRDTKGAPRKPKQPMLVKFGLQRSS